MAESYSLSLVGWFLYVGVPAIIWTSTALWYLTRRQTPTDAPGERA